jgi:hypothetical protein
LTAAFTFSLHEGVDVGPAYFVDLLHLDWEPVIREQAAFGGLGADGENAAIDALEQFDISHSVACVLEEAAAVGGGYRRDGIGDGLA